MCGLDVCWRIPIAGIIIIDYRKAWSQLRQKYYIHLFIGVFIIMNDVNLTRVSANEMKRKKIITKQFQRSTEDHLRAAR